MIKTTVRDYVISNQEYQIEIKPGESIRLFGIYHNRVNGPVAFDRTFYMNDIAEYHSYNLRYTGKIISIAPKTVTIQAYSGTLNEKNHRLSLMDFAWRNWDFDAEECAAHNANEMMYI